MTPYAHDFSFDADNHIYRLDGIRIPSFSEIARIEGLSDYSAVDPLVMSAAADFGGKGHRMIQLWSEGNLDESTLDKNLVPYLDGFKKFVEQYKVSFTNAWIERPTFSARWQYGIKPDFIGSVGGKTTVVEYKFTSSILPVVAIQTAAQQLAFEEQTGKKVSQRICLQLLEGDFRVEKFTKQEDKLIWCAAVNMYTWKKEHKLLKENGNGRS